MKLFGALISVAVLACADARAQEPAAAAQVQSIGDPGLAAVIGCLTARNRDNVVTLAERLQLTVISGAETLTASFPPLHSEPGTHVDSLVASWRLGPEQQSLEYAALRIQGGNFTRMQYSCHVRARVADAASVARTLSAVATAPVTARLSEGGYLLVARATRGEAVIMVSIRFSEPLGADPARVRGRIPANAPGLGVYLPRMGRQALVSFANPSLDAPG